MQSVSKNFSLIERLTVVAIILAISAIGIESLLQSVRDSEERTINTGSVEYSTVRKMYAESYPASYPNVATVEVISANNTQN
jgi:type II secretory pathway pseudopilin PulG